MSARYEARLQRVLTYIHDNPDGDLSLDALAEVAALSRFHFHRVFRAVTGETCAQAVRRLRAHRASLDLVHGQLPLAEIARRNGYDNEQSFARLFRKLYGLPPQAFRARGRVYHVNQPFLTGGPTMYPFEIRDCPALRVTSLMHKGPFPEMGRAYEALSIKIAAADLWPKVQGSVGIYPMGPDDAPTEELVSHAGFILDEDAPLPEGTSELDVPAGSRLVVTVKGDYSGLHDAWHHVYSNILPKSGRDLADQPPIEVYLNDMHNTAPEDLVTEIHIPLLPQ